MLLKEKGKLVSDEKQLASIMNKLFINITKSLNLKEDQPSRYFGRHSSKKCFQPSIDKTRKKKVFFPTSNRRKLGASY